MDSFRFYLAKDPFGGDISFNDEALLAVHNNELADVLVRFCVFLCHCRVHVPRLSMMIIVGGADPIFYLERPKPSTNTRSPNHLQIQGNLVHRAVNLCHKFCDGKVPPLANPAAPWAGLLPVPFDLEALRARVAVGMETFALKVRKCVWAGGWVYGGGRSLVCWCGPVAGV